MNKLNNQKIYKDIEDVLSVIDVKTSDYGKIMVDYILGQMGKKSSTKAVSDAIKKIENLDIQFQILERISVMTKDGDIVLRPYCYLFADKLKAYKKGNPEDIPFMMNANNFPKSAWDALEVYKNFAGSVHEVGNSMAYALALNPKTKNIAIAFNKIKKQSLKNRVALILLNEEWQFIPPLEIKNALCSTKTPELRRKIRVESKKEPPVIDVFEEYAKCNRWDFLPKDYGLWMAANETIDVFNFKNKYENDNDKISLPFLEFARKEINKIPLARLFVPKQMSDNLCKLLVMSILKLDKNKGFSLKSFNKKTKDNIAKIDIKDYDNEIKETQAYKILDCLINSLKFLARRSDISFNRTEVLAKKYTGKER